MGTTWPSPVVVGHSRVVFDTRSNFLVFVCYYGFISTLVGIIHRLPFLRGIYVSVGFINAALSYIIALPHLQNI